ncbi:hypothetical protein B0A58_13070 [Flavobacterium branchiophilum NBRC 15030 = ATCC 35035]|uniref:Uncharacterized protein n=1 Tax=Flavobacterium branchiophilum TaxID=55197 RepID=A0A543G3L1_9FLAO|nr:hypothetical protein [Flavobacterium branchiophilum]OXA72116.1 hypothetical protein B0A58_13070 [Flavobacterium branchiophilum NBRC 15030 = ATCC 35035]TQM40645.1 hypothetical protein BC670_1547 [Flavobacterium branchiophilum]GEM54274.1 hypothetical protein FB1_04950 [Flavobacterium branchiophilum NBRC 15030 = ATCC 35035]
MLQLVEKINYLKELLSNPSDSYSDSFNTEIGFYFNEFEDIEANERFHFLEKFKTKEEIENWLDNLKSNIVLKFREDEEDLFDFIHFFTL